MSLFPGFTEERIALPEITLFVRHGGTQGKPPLVLLHGYPQTSAMWHGVAADLASDFHLIIPDLRGYGRSDKPPSTDDHFPYSKRAMAGDIAALIDHFGYESAHIGAHDRGARVAHRLGLDHPARVRDIVMLDIAPTREMYATGGDALARAYWHWYFLIQPAPLPEMLIEGNPREFWRLKCGIQTKGGDPFHPEAKEEYLTAFDDPATIHAMCEDYRAAATIDIAHDDADGGAKLEMPLHVLWGDRGTIEVVFDALALWRLRASNVTGHAMPGTHYFAEEHPVEVAAELRAFFLRQG
ncbi:alpha/beta fold hydrolase [Jannaschia seohaensis]|uniref:Haloacetate dehalogenase n=1 Tax=Jannaschia seohaensis TaxID=475081 RepID=A0A2Y9A0N0_9RHOB|nr:alpha/beta hydrolase [Jannaschia seohaensis]PWJ21813.1 haloacetate dehalogenase [Jannaschia seohaensis]SSA38091.1 haloacetate dehalogenase [Jannaschia seohaensis]